MRFRELLAAFLVGLALLALLDGLLLASVAPSGHGDFLTWANRVFLAVCGLGGNELSREYDELGWQLAQLLTAVIAISWPAVVLGSIVFRLFVRTEIFVLRTRVSVLRDPDSLEGEKGSYLAIRLYNASPLQPVGVSFALRLQTYIQHRTAGPTRANLPVKVVNSEWPIAERHVPYTLYVELEEGDIDPDEDRLCAIQGHPVSARAELLIYISGDVPDLGTTTNEFHRISLEPEDVSFDGFHGITVRYDGRSREWKGWSDFDAPTS